MGDSSRAILLAMPQVKWSAKWFDKQSNLLHIECQKRKQFRQKKRGRTSVNARELLYLASQYAVADGEPIDAGADVEIWATCGNRCNHIIITADGSMYVNGWVVAAVVEPSAIHRVIQHAELPQEHIQALFKRFERAKSCTA